MIKLENCWCVSVLVCECVSMLVCLSVIVLVCKSFTECKSDGFWFASDLYFFWNFFPMFFAIIGTFRPPKHFCIFFHLLSVYAIFQAVNS